MKVYQVKKLEDDTFKVIKNHKNGKVTELRQVFKTRKGCVNAAIFKNLGLRQSGKSDTIGES